MPDNEVLRVIRERRSVRAYEKRQISGVALEAILVAASYAPYAAAEQPWHFSVVQNEALLARLEDAADEGARMAGGFFAELANDTAFHCLYGAPTLIVVSAGPMSPAPQVDCAIAAQNMLIAAQSLSVASCWLYYIMLAFSSPQGEELRTSLCVPEGYAPHAGVLLGYAQGDIPPAAPRKQGNTTVIR